jgi:hypothetical protein
MNDIATTSLRDRFIAALPIIARDLSERPTLDAVDVKANEWQPDYGLTAVVLAYMPSSADAARSIVAAFDGDWTENGHIGGFNEVYLVLRNQREGYTVQVTIARKLMITTPPVYPGLAELLAGNELTVADGEIVDEDDEGDEVTDHHADVAKEDADDVDYGDES